jgi:esterase/lipase/carbon monoxide dehydrogenase subunit G
MIEINEKFTVAASPAEVYAVLSDPNAVVECVQGAALTGQNEDGTYNGAMTVKFSALRVSFAGRVALELDDEERRGTVKASGRDGQGGTKFQATASFKVDPVDDGTASEVRANGEVVLSGKLASMIEGAATAVVRRMTGEFVEALSLRCASGSTQLGPAAAVTPPAQPTAATVETTATKPVEPAAPAKPTAAVLLLHGFGGSPNGVRPWGEALAAAGLAVSIPRLPGHGTRWKDLRRTTWADWYAEAEKALNQLRAEHGTVFVAGISLGATLALRLAEKRPNDVAGVVAVNPILSAPAGVPKPLGLMRFLRRSSAAVRGDIKKSGGTDVGYDRTSLRAAYSLEQFGQLVRADLGQIRQPVLLATSRVDHVVAAADGEAVWSAMTAAAKRRLWFDNSYHLVTLDNDAPVLFAESANFITSPELVGRP